MREFIFFGLNVKLAEGSAGVCGSRAGRCAKKGDVDAPARKG